MIKLIKDVKVEVWKRYYYEVDKEDSLNDIEGTINNIYLDNIICKNEEFLFDTEEPLSINDNDDQATVEIFLDGFEDSFNKIFNNVDEKINYKIINEKFNNTERKIKELLSFISDNLNNAELTKVAISELNELKDKL